MSGPAPIPTAREILSRNWSPPMSASIRFAIVARPACTTAKPVAFGSLADLCAHIHRKRAGRSLSMLNSPLKFEGEEKPRQGVSLWAYDIASARSEFLGWVWLDGGPRQRLMAALEIAEPQLARHREAA